MHRLRPLLPDDLSEIRQVYADAVLSQGAPLYSPAQLQAWAGHAGDAAALAIPLQEGFGLASTAPAPTAGQTTIEAFGLLHPPERLALLYCRGRASRQGRASTILRALEQHARQQGILRLRTEASQLSRPLLERRGWQVEEPETLLFAGAWFMRWRMIKVLSANGGRFGDDERG